MIRRRFCFVALYALFIGVWGTRASGQFPAEDLIDASHQHRQAEVEELFRKKVTPFIRSYCLECHQNRRPTEAGVNFSPALKAPNHPAFTAQWKNAAARVAAHDMPPDGLDQPTAEERKMFVDWQSKIKYLSSKDPGPFIIRRLTKSEYANTLHDLFGVDPSVADSLPDEVSGAGYLNSLSPLQLEQYLTIASKVLQEAWPEGKPPEEFPVGQPFKMLDAAGQSSDALIIRAEEIAEFVAATMYRRPASVAEVETLVEVFRLGQSNGLDFQPAVRLMTKAALVSPQFLFITPVEQADASEAIVPLGEYQLASRLSYFLWATMPDAELMQLAAEGRLNDKGVLRSQVKRMLASPKSRALFDGFGAQWLGLDDWRDRTFDRNKFPEMTAELREAMYEEARMVFESVVRQDLSLETFITGDFTFLNGPLAEIYGIEEIEGQSMRRVSLSDKNRGGILAMPAVLTATSFPNRTSPVNRGVWVLEQVLGENVPPAPPDVPPLEEQSQATDEGLTMRQLTEMHREDPVCANCHRLLDPIGFGLENFDAIGRWRENDSGGAAIDSSGTLPDGSSFSTPAELKAMVAGRLDDFARNLAEKMLAYALCRSLEGYDEIVVDEMMQRVAGDDFRMQTLISEVVTSYPFTHRRIQDER